MTSNKTESVVDTQLSSMKSSGPKALEWTNEMIRKFWNYQSQVPESYFTARYGEQISDLVGDYVPNKSIVLDYGCGTGALTEFLLKKNFLVTSCDLSEDSIFYVNRKFTGLAGFNGAINVADLLSSKCKFDAAVLVEVVEHLDDPSLVSILETLKLVLSKDGIIVITTPNDEDLNSETVYCPNCNSVFHRWQHLRSWNSIAIEKFLTSYGFSIVKVLQVDLSISKDNGLFRYFARKVINKFLKRKNPHLVVVARSINTEK